MSADDIMKEIEQVNKEFSDAIADMDELYSNLGTGSWPENDWWAKLQDAHNKLDIALRKRKASARKLHHCLRGWE